MGGGTASPPVAPPSPTIAVAAASYPGNHAKTSSDRVAARFPVPPGVRKMMKKLVTALPLLVASFAAVACSDGSAPARLGAPSTAQRAASAASQPGALIPDQYIVVF